MQFHNITNTDDYPVVELYTTSTGHSIKVKKDCNRLRDLLNAKKVPFVEVKLVRMRQAPIEGMTAVCIAFWVLPGGAEAHREPFSLFLRLARHIVLK